MSAPLEAAPGVAAITAYRVPSPPFPADLRLDGTEASAEAWGQYPDAGPLEETIAARLGIAARRVIVTAGADEALDRACRAVLCPGRSIVLPSPTFEMLDRYAALAGADVVRVPWPEGPYPVEAVLASVRAETAAVAAVSPNNPTGTVATGGDLRRLAEAAPRAALLVDLAYVEFADDDPTGLALSLPNAIVFRTFSKAWGLPGLRVGYAAGPEEWIGWMRTAGGPYPVASTSLALVAKRLETGESAMRAHVARVRTERDALESLLASLGARPSRSQGSFVFARFDDAAVARAGLARRGIAVRAFPGAAGLGDGLRITLPGDAARFARLAAAFEEVLS